MEGSVYSGLKSEEKRVRTLPGPLSFFEVLPARLLSPSSSFFLRFFAGSKTPC